MPEERFPYGGPPWFLLLGALIAGGGAAALVVEAAAGRAVALGPLPPLAGAPVYALAMICLSVALVALAQLLRMRAAGPRALVVGDGWIEAPRSPWTRATVRIERAAVTKVERAEQRRTRFLVLETAGERLALNSVLVGEAGLAAVERWLGSPRG